MASGRSRLRRAPTASPRPPGELHVTPAAISRMVQLLEQRLGVALFERKANRLALTAAGRAYQSRPDADLRPARQPDRAGHRDGGFARADCRRRADLCDAWLIPRLADFQKSEPGYRSALRHRRRDVALQRRLDLRHQARRRRLAGLRRRALVCRRLHAGLRPGDGASSLRRRMTCGRDAAARRARRRRMADLVQVRRDFRRFAPKVRSSNTTARPCRPRPTASALRSASAPMSTTI